MFGNILKENIYKNELTILLEISPDFEDLYTTFTIMYTPRTLLFTSGLL